MFRSMRASSAPTNRNPITSSTFWPITRRTSNRTIRRTRTEATKLIFVYPGVFRAISSHRDIATFTTKWNTLCGFKHPSKYDEKLSAETPQQGQHEADSRRGGQHQAHLRLPCHEGHEPECDYRQVELLRPQEPHEESDVGVG